MIAVIRYGAGNVTSIMNALFKIGADARLTSDKDEIERRLDWVDHFYKGQVT